MTGGALGEKMGMGSRGEGRGHRSNPPPSHFMIFFFLLLLHPHHARTLSPAFRVPLSPLWECVTWWSWVLGGKAG